MTRKELIAAIEARRKGNSFFRHASLGSLEVLVARAKEPGSQISYTDLQDFLAALN